MTKLQQKRFENALKLLSVNNFRTNEVTNYTSKLSNEDQDIFAELLLVKKNKGK